MTCNQTSLFNEITSRPTAVRLSFCTLTFILIASCGLRTTFSAPREAADGPLTVRAAETIIYIAKNQPSILNGGFVQIRYNGERSVEGFFDVQGEAVRYLITANVPTVLQIDTPKSIADEIERLKTKPRENESDAFRRTAMQLLEAKLILIKQVGGLSYTFLKAGDVSIRVEVGKNHVDLPIKVVQISVSPGDESEKVVETFGLPDRKTNVYVRWPESESLDGLFYKPSASESSISADHWKYDKYPGLVLSIRDGTLNAIATYSDSGTEADVVAKPELDTDDDPFAEPKNKIVAKPEGLRTWTAKSGHKAEAVYVGYEEGKVILKSAEGKTTKVLLSKLSDADRKYVREQIRIARDKEAEEEDAAAEGSRRLRGPNRER